MKWQKSLSQGLSKELPENVFMIFKEFCCHRKRDFFNIGDKDGKEWRQMAKKKKKQMRETLYCPYCKRPGVLRPAAYVYGDNNLDPEKYLYVCSGYPSCDSYIGAHKKSMRPMGTMADSNLRNKRIEAHRALDAIWKNGYMTKHSTYIWLQNRLNLRERTHISGNFLITCVNRPSGNVQTI